MTVVQFPRRDEHQIVWRCNCGSLSHYLRADGELQCTNCKVVDEGETGEWRKNLPPVPDDVPETQDGDVVTTDLNSPEMAIRRALTKADHSKLSGLVLVFHDGRITAWSNIETSEQKAWLGRRFDDALNLFPVEE